MDHEIEVVHEDPLAGPLPFHVPRPSSVHLPEALLDGVGDGRGLAFGGTVTDDESVGDVAQAAEIEDRDVLGFLVGGGLEAGGKAGGQVAQGRPSITYSP